MKYFLFGFSFVIALCIIVAGLGWLLAAVMFSSYSKHTLDTLQEVASPGGQFVATWYVDTGGGAAGWCMAEVNIRNTGTELPPNDELFATHCGTKVELAWDSDSQLKITFRPDRADFGVTQKSMSKDASVRIRYVEELATASGDHTTDRASTASKEK